MPNKYVVTDEEGNVSWNDKTEKAESFKTFEAAKKRAANLAEYAPGREIGIYELVGRVSALVGPLKVSRE